ncbi:MAG: sulfatase-like hydrolase/transferase [Undibacterium sp.]|nr:sulfatase-like hydrolase/transferase [Opitutaceae bacterium]
MLGLLGLLICHGACSLRAAAPATATARPNIIFILADDLGYGDLGVFYQNARRAAADRSRPWHFTPQLDRMAAEGARFTDQYVGGPVCAASRSSLLLGVHQGHANVRDNQFDKALESNHTLGTVLRQAGYATAIVGKWGLPGNGSDWPAHPQNRGFDYFYGYMRHVDGHEHYPKEAPYFAAKAQTFGPVRVWENHTDVTASLDKCYTTDLFTARAKHWIAAQHRRAPDQPFFLYLAFDTPHAVLERPTQAYPAGGGLGGGVQWLGSPGHAINTATGRIDSWTHPDYAAATYDDDHDPATPERPWPEVYRRYATSVRRIDESVGDLLQLLKDLRLDENTLVVFASDNGPSTESYLPEGMTPEFFASYGPFDGIKRDCWEGGLRTPTVARWPAHIPAGRVLSEPSGNWDWLPTFAALARLPAPARADGISLLPALTGRGRAAPRDYLYFEYFVKSRTPDYPGFEPARRNRPRGQMQAVRLGDLMAVRYDLKSADENFEIYDVVRDPKEAHDLAADPAFADAQTRFKAIAVQSRRPDPDAPRPYDDTPLPADTTRVTRPGVVWRYYEGAFPWVPAFASLLPAAEGTQPALDLTPLRRAVDCGLQFTGYLDVPADGIYTFTLRTDTGAVLRLHEATVIDADYGYASGREQTATIRLRSGLHLFSLSYRRGGSGTPALAWRWSGPGLAAQPIPASALRH